MTENKLYLALTSKYAIAIVGLTMIMVFSSYLYNIPLLEGLVKLFWLAGNNLDKILIYLLLMVGVYVLLFSIPLSEWIRKKIASLQNRDES